MTVNEATTQPEVRTELPGRAELEAARWALGRIPLKIELRWASALRAGGAYDVAADLIEGIRTHHGETASWLEEAARLAFSEGRYDQAEGFLRARLDRFPTATAEVALGRFLLETGRLVEADKIAQRLVSAYADHVTVTMLAADVARAQNQRELARNYYLAVVDARGEHPSGLLMMAELALEDGDLDVAREFQRRVLHAYRSGEYPLWAGTAQKIARVAEALEDTDAAEEFRARAASEQQASREKTATAIWDALREAGALRRPPDEPDNEAAPNPGATSAPTPPVKPNGASALERVSGSKKLAVIESPVAGSRERAPRPEALEALKELFGHDQFRSGQVDVIERVLDGVDTLAIIPTGGGKSLTYQLPAMLVPGVTLVVSPLIALMKDQVENAPASVRDRVTLINSDIDADERHRRLAGVRDGQIKLLYVAPERLLDPTLRRSLMTAGIARIVIDEAHCISLWGHDFRPDYLTIPLALRDFGNPPVLAVTATATPEMAQQIATALGREMELVRTSVFRENLFYEVVPVADRNERIEKLIDLCGKETGSGIIYVSSRKDAESFAETLYRRGVNTAPYHAGMPRELRASAHERFMAGQTRVMVATVAFGMGVDKANVRFIIHMMPPGTVESYAQESGRAGRDGRRARCLLLTAPSDRGTLRARARRDLVPIESLRKTYKEVRARQRAGWSAVNIDELRRSLNQGVDEKDEIDARVALGYLQQAELIARAPDAPVRFWVRRKAMAGMPFDEFEEEDPLWTALLPKLGEGWQRGETIELDAAETCAALAIEPAQLDALLGDRPDVQLNRDQRSAWYRLLPAPTEAGRVMERLLAQAKRRTDDRIDQMMTYIDGHECRHRMLAAALGEAISPCGDACDVCDPVHALVPPSPTQKSTRSKRTANAADALVILRTIPDLPYQMGKRGLVWLLGGSPESRLQADRSQAFGALKELGPTRIGRLIDQLVEGGFLEWRIDGEYRLVGMTSKGAGATRKDLEFLPGLSAPVESRTDLVDLAPHDTALYDRLVNWRSQEASEQRVPPYVIAHNTMLREIARVRPTSVDQLLSVGGFGKTRVERYGEAIVRIVNESRIEGS